jgi:hypothetical protein
VTSGFAEPDFARAVAVVGGAASPQALAAELGIDWEYLTLLGLGVANEVLDDPSLATGGAQAFYAGFLIGVHLEERDDPVGDRLPLAVELVGRRGLHAVIADRCDLAAVARFESTYATALVASLDLRADAEPPLTRLFESGLATGLALGYL